MVASSACVAATATAPGYAAGYDTRLRPSLPAAQMTVVPLLWAYSTAFFSTFDGNAPPRLMFMTFAPLSAA